MKRRVGKTTRNDLRPAVMRYIGEAIISDPQWDRLKHLPGRSNLSRGDIEVIIKIYHDMRPYPDANYPALRKEMQKARKREVYSLELLRNTVATDNVYLPIAHGLDWTVPLTPEQQQSDRQHIEMLVKEKEWLVGFYDRAIKRVTHASPRDKKAQNSLRFLLTSLLYRLADKDFSVSESKPITKFIWEVCKIVDPKIKPSTVETLITDIVHEEKAWETEPRERVLVIRSSDPRDPFVHIVSPLFPLPRIDDWR